VEIGAACEKGTLLKVLKNASYDPVENLSMPRYAFFRVDCGNPELALGRGF
jgi:hypothetical protein